MNRKTFCEYIPYFAVYITEPAGKEDHQTSSFPAGFTQINASSPFTGEGYVGIPYLNNAQVAVTFNNIVVNTDLQLVSGYVETRFDLANNNMLFDVDKALTGGQGVGDIRTGEERAAFNVDYTINPNIKALPVKTDDSQDNISESGNYTFSKGENGTYELILTDDEGNEHKLESETIPFTIKDKNGGIRLRSMKKEKLQVVLEAKQQKTKNQKKWKINLSH